MPITESILRQMLDKMQVSLLQHNDKKVYLRSTPQLHEAKLQQALALKSLPAILPQNLLKSYC